MPYSDIAKSQESKTQTQPFVIKINPKVEKSKRKYLFRGSLQEWKEFYEKNKNTPTSDLVM